MGYLQPRLQQDLLYCKKPEDYLVREFIDIRAVSFITCQYINILFSTNYTTHPVRHSEMNCKLVKWVNWG